jgi:hypothetical protein
MVPTLFAASGYWHSSYANGARMINRMNIYVGNLPYSVRDNDLLALFEEFGNVSSAKVVMDREPIVRRVWFRGDAVGRRRQCCDQQAEWSRDQWPCIARERSTPA